MKVEAIKGILDSNTFIATKGDTVLIVDAGATLPDVTPDAIILTHEHFDHIRHIADYAKEFDCPIYCHPVLIEDLRSKNFSRILGKVAVPGNFDNFIPVTDETEFQIGDFTIQPIMATGHSACSIVFKIDNNLFTGDVLFRAGIGRTDFMPNGPELMQATLKKLHEVSFDFAYHGHGGKSDFTDQHANIHYYMAN